MKTRDRITKGIADHDFAIEEARKLALIQIRLPFGSPMDAYESAKQLAKYAGVIFSRLAQRREAVRNIGLLENTQREREAHHAALHELALSLNPKQTRSGLELWRVLSRIEREAHAAAAAHCNGEPFTPSLARTYHFGSNETDWEDYVETVKDKVLFVFGALPPGFFVNGDARGYALKLASNDAGTEKATPFNLHSDWGSNQILAPTIE